MGVQGQEPWLLGARPRGGLRDGLARVSMPQFLRVVLPLSAVFLLAFVLEYRSEAEAEQARLLTQETFVIERGVRWVQRELEFATGDLLLVGDLVKGAVDSDDPERFAALERSLLALVRRRPDYLQIRFLSATGQELVRVENSSSGPRLVPETELQGKGGRSYFTGTMRLAAGEVFVSPMSLNVERGVVEEPYKPVVRFATPIDDGAGQRRGVVVLNARAAQFLRAFERSDDESGIQRMVVNSDGYWLQYRPELEWGFMLEHGRGFQRTFPEIWEQMVASGRGRVETNEGLFYFDTVSPAAVSAEAHDEGQGQGFWMLISLVSREVLDGVTVRVATPLLVIAMPMYFTLLVISWLLAAALQRRKMADEALRSLEGVRSAMMTAALDAIIVMDESGTALEFNPMAQQIFGYTLEEARGKLVADLIIPQARREAHRLGLKNFLATGEGPIIDKHITEITAIRKGGAEFPVELTICPIFVEGKQVFFGFLRDLSGE
jgi:PAS domain S-box-containing protein